MSIFKSVIGLNLDELREQFTRQALGGVDLIKDDEILFENALTPIEKRVEACIKAAESAERETGKKLLYAANLTGPTSQLKTQALKAIDAGANALLFNVLAYGYDVLHELSSDPAVRCQLLPILRWRELLIHRRIMVFRRPSCSVSLCAWLALTSSSSLLPTAQ